MSEQPQNYISIATGNEMDETFIQRHTHSNKQLLDNLENELSNYALKETVYTKNEIDTKLNSLDTYTKDEIDSKTNIPQIREPEVFTYDGTNNSFIVSYDIRFINDVMILGQETFTYLQRDGDYTVTLPRSVSVAHTLVSGDKVKISYVS